MLVAGAVVLSQSTHFSYAMDETMVSIIVQGVGRKSIPITPGQPWESAIEPLTQSFGPGKLIYAGKALNPSELIPRDILSQKLSQVTFIPMSPIPMSPPSSELEQQGWELLDSTSESDINRGSILMAYSQIKKAIEAKDWATAIRRFDRMGDDAKADPIAQAMKREIDHH